MLLNQEDLALNQTGTLSGYQLKKIKRKGVVQVVAGACFLIIVPAAVLMSDVKLGIVLIIWLIAGLFFAGLFFWSAKDYLNMKAAGNRILSITGVVSLKNSGSKHVVATVNERGFLLMKNESSTLKSGESYTLYYIDDPRVVVGWTKEQVAVNNDQLARST
jgi:hypothetical protein